MRYPLQLGSYNRYRSSLSRIQNTASITTEGQQGKIFIVSNFLQTRTSQQPQFFRHGLGFAAAFHAQFLQDMTDVALYGGQLDV